MDIKNAKFLNKDFYRTDIVEWWCPMCEASGDADTVDFLPSERWWAELSYEEKCERIVQWVCGECFEEGIYVEFEKDVISGEE